MNKTQKKIENWNKSSSQYQHIRFIPEIVILPTAMWRARANRINLYYRFFFLIWISLILKDLSLPHVQAAFRKGRGTREQIANILWIIKKAREFQKNIYFCFSDYVKAFNCVDHNKLWKILKEMDDQTTWSASWELCMQVRKQQLELDMEQQTGSK